MSAVDSITGVSILIVPYRLRRYKGICVLVPDNFCGAKVVGHSQVCANHHGGLELDHPARFQPQAVNVTSAASSMAKGPMRKVGRFSAVSDLVQN